MIRGDDFFLPVSHTGKRRLAVEASVKSMYSGVSAKPSHQQARLGRSTSSQTG
jgi:hypothetical protein